MCTTAAAGWQLMVNPGGHSWLIVGIFWEESSEGSRTWSICGADGWFWPVPSFSSAQTPWSLAWHVGKARMNWRNVVSGGCKLSVSTDFYFIWGTARDRGFWGRLFAGLILVSLLCLQTSCQTFLGRSGGVGTCGVLEQGWRRGPALHRGSLWLRWVVWWHAARLVAAIQSQGLNSTLVLEGGLMGASVLQHFPRVLTLWS